MDRFSTIPNGAGLEDLQLSKLWVVYPGKKIYPLSEKITTLPLEMLGTELQQGLLAITSYGGFGS